MINFLKLFLFILEVNENLLETSVIQGAEQQ